MFIDIYEFLCYYIRSDITESNNVVETREDFKIEKCGLKIFAPKADDGVIKMKTKESTINLKLPEDRSANKVIQTVNFDIDIAVDCEVLRCERNIVYHLFVCC